ncbi:MAG: hypothetical protein ACOC80_14350 [Petrotogales bacterium]
MAKDEFPLLLLYDVDSAKLQRKIKKICNDYGLKTIQYSIAAGKLVRRRRMMLEDRIENDFNDIGTARCHVVLIPLDQNVPKEIKIFGKPLSIFQTPASVVLIEGEDYKSKGDFRAD